VGDVNSTLACALVEVKKGVPVAHVEAGQRSDDGAMPEEINRILTDQISDRLYTTERSAVENLAREGIPSSRVCLAGNVMIDSVVLGGGSARNPKDTLQSAGVDPSVLDHPRGFGVVTLHRPSNVDDAPTLRALLGALAEVSSSLPLVFALHPRTRSNIQRFGLMDVIDPVRMIFLPPQGYLEMLGLMVNATVVLTDFGELQEEATALGISCLILRENTERPITVEQGTNTLVGRDAAAIHEAVRKILAGQGKRGRIPELWDGHAAERIVSDLHPWLNQMPAMQVAE
jgi:UDP-N-acetylglucosamine 2-epimerase (non-hydrolysing)